MMQRKLHSLSEQFSGAEHQNEKKSVPLRPPSPPGLGRSLLDLQATAGNQAVARLLRERRAQATLKISQPGDPLEQEADRVAETVIRMSPQGRARALSEGTRVSSGGQEEMHDANEDTQREATPASYGAPSHPSGFFGPAKGIRAMPLPINAEAPTQSAGGAFEQGAGQIAMSAVRNELDKRNRTPTSEVHDAQQLAYRTAPGAARMPRALPDTSVLPASYNASAFPSPGGGRPLGTKMRLEMETRFGVAFGKVRVHAGELAAKATHSVNARAFTIGHNIVFGAGEYRPDTRSGKRLLAHELAHVAQQQRLSKRAIQRDPTISRKAPEGETAVASPSPDEKSKMETSRPMSRWEVGQARLVFGDAIDYESVTIADGSLLARIMSLGGYARTVGNTIFFPTGGSADMAWMVHELTHVWQYQKTGWTYAIKAIWAQLTEGYNYTENGKTPEQSLRDARTAGKTLYDYNFEQQGDLLADYYRRLQGGKDPSAWQPFVNDVK